MGLSDVVTSILLETFVEQFFNIGPVVQCSPCIEQLWNKNGLLHEGIKDTQVSFSGCILLQVDWHQMETSDTMAVVHCLVCSILSIPRTPRL